MAQVDPAWMEHQRRIWLRHDWQKWMPPDPGPSVRERLWRPYREESSAETPGPSPSELAALRQSLSALRLQLMLIEAELRRKAGFNPDQPRDDNGRWTDAGGTQGEPPTTEPPNPPGGPLGGSRSIQETLGKGGRRRQKSRQQKRCPRFRPKSRQRLNCEIVL